MAGEAPDEVDVPIETDADIVAARQAGRALATRAGCTNHELTEVATAISELARNIVNYAGSGRMAMRLVDRGERNGLRITVSDKGPGIPDLEQAMKDGFTTGSGLGLGLPGARRLMDEFDITSEIGQGTTVVMVKWGTAR